MPLPDPTVPGTIAPGTIAPDPIAPDPFVDAFDRQAAACRDLGSPFNAMVCTLLRERLTADSSFGRRIRDWPGQPVADALALRACGGLHALARSGRCPALTAIYPPTAAGPEAVWAGIAAATEDHDAFLAGWLDSPPQTNEVARSGMILGGCLWIAGATGMALEIFEIGSSAGLNLGFDRYRYDLGVRTWGDAASPVRIAARWEGEPPIDARLAVAGRAGCDRSPLDPADPADRDRLLAYVWPDQADRLARIAAALDVAAASGRRVERADAADWVERRFAGPGEPGRVRVLLHTIVWQYLPADVQRRIEAAITAAGAAATADRPVAWLRVEPDGVPGSAGIRVTVWPAGETLLLGRADYHGRWTRWEATAAR